MRLGNGMGGVAAVDSVWGRRLPLVLMAVALVAAGLFFSAPAADADNGGDASFSLLDPYCEEIEGPEGFVDVKVKNDEDGGLGDMNLVELRLYEEDDSDWEEVDSKTGFEGNLQDGIAEGAESDLYTFSYLEVYSTTYRVEADVEWYGDDPVTDTIVSSSFTVPECVQTFFDCAIHDCSEIVDPFGGNWTADVDCGTTCTVEILEPESFSNGDPVFADMITSAGAIIKLTANKGVGTPPGRAYVTVESDDPDDALPKCHHKKQPTNCQKIKRIKGGKTFYYVKYGVDPRFRFR